MIHLTEKGPSTFVLKGKKKKKEKPQAKPNFFRLNSKPQSEDKKLKGNCYICESKGHWKKQCPTFLSRKNGNDSLTYIIETCFVVKSTTIWCVDSRVTNHFCNCLQRFHVTKVVAIGNLVLNFGEDNKLELTYSFL